MSGASRFTAVSPTKIVAPTKEGRGLVQQPFYMFSFCGTSKLLKMRWRSADIRPNVVRTTTSAFSVQHPLKENKRRVKVKRQEADTDEITTLSESQKPQLLPSVYIHFIRERRHHTENESSPQFQRFDLFRSAFSLHRVKLAPASIKAKETAPSLSPP